MKSKIYTGHILHHRLDPVDHRFKYGVDFYGFDLSELSELDRGTSGFGYNRFQPVAIHDRDYLQRGPESIETKLRDWLDKMECRKPVHRIVLITAARYLNYVFNPVSFYLCYGEPNQLHYVVAEVNNTFGERHLYVLDDIVPDRNGWKSEARHPKAFHVSPFNDRSGSYAFQFKLVDDELDIRVDLYREEKCVLLTRLSGKAAELNGVNLFKTIIRHPLRAALTFPRILGQAGRLYFGKKLPWHKKPKPDHHLTIRHPTPSFLEQRCLKLVLRLFARIQNGLIRLQLPEGRVMNLGDQSSERTAELTVKEYAFFKKLVFKGSIGLGESYVDGDWDSAEPAILLSILGDNRDEISEVNPFTSMMSRGLDRFGHVLRRNTKTRSRKNIQEHYDLGNDFYQTFLDPSMTYSCALYQGPSDSLEAAQRNKLAAMIRNADIQKGHHVLEIGSGWGSFAIEAAKTTGCRVTSITLSQEQFDLAREKVRRAHLENLVDIRICDYRDIEGLYDRVVSIEMLEAVGEEHFDTYFKQIEKRLKPGGRAAIQVITIPDDRYDGYRRRCDWIQKHIFPGGFLPALKAIRSSWQTATTLQLDSVENIGPDYARTLEAWGRNFMEQIESVKSLGFDETFCRKWMYYLAYCEAGFATRTLDVLHLSLQKPGGGEHSSMETETVSNKLKPGILLQSAEKLEG